MDATVILTDVSCSTDERRDAIEEMLAQRGGSMRMRDIPTSWNQYDRGRDVVALKKSGRVVTCRHRGETWLATRVELLPEADEEEISGVHRLPMLLEGDGEKRDCARWDGCLDRFVRQSPTAREAHCPQDCADFATLPSHVRLGLVAPYSRPGTR